MGRIIVIGAGITGITTTDALLERGHELVVLERHPYPAMEASFANGGQLSASNAEVWNHPSTLIKGVRWLFRKDAPLRFDMRLSILKYEWLAEFAVALRGYKRNTIQTCASPSRRANISTRSPSARRSISICRDEASCTSTITTRTCGTQDT